MGDNIPLPEGGPASLSANAGTLRPGHPDRLHNTTRLGDADAPRWCDAHRVAVSSNVLFRDRHEAGRALAGLLEHYRGRDDVIVLGLPRGGVPVAYEVATALEVPLDVFLVRKLRVPGA